MKNDLSIADIKRKFNLEPLPVEGGWFTRTYLSKEIIPQDALPDRYTTEKHFGSAILFLLTPEADCFSALHNLPTDEIYHFYLGDPVELLQLHPDGHSEHIILGQDILAGQRVQYVARRGIWQGSRLIPGGSFALLGTTMAPGFSNDDFYNGCRSELVEQYPHEAELIRALTRPHDPRRMP